MDLSLSSCHLLPLFCAVWQQGEDGICLLFLLTQWLKQRVGRNVVYIPMMEFFNVCCSVQQASLLENVRILSQHRRINDAPLVLCFLEVGVWEEKEKFG